MIKNNFQFIGNLGADPEIKAYGEGKKLASMSLAISDKYKDRNGESQERTTWVNLTCFREGLVGLIEKYLKKGSKIAVNGSFGWNKYKDSEGNEKQSPQFTVLQLEFLGGKVVETATTEPAAPYKSPEKTKNSDEENESDLPF